MPSPQTNLPGQWPQYQANGSNVCRVLRSTRDQGKFSRLRPMNLQHLTMAHQPSTLNTQHSTRGQVKFVLQGGMGTCFAFGQTGSGATPCALHSTPYTLHPTPSHGANPHTLHFTPHTTHHTPYILNCANPCTLHPQMCQPSHHTPSIVPPPTQYTLKCAKPHTPRPQLIRHPTPDPPIQSQARDPKLECKNRVVFARRGFQGSWTL